MRKNQESETKYGERFVSGLGDSGFEAGELNSVATIAVGKEG